MPLRVCQNGPFCEESCQEGGQGADPVGVVVVIIDNVSDKWNEAFLLVNLENPLQPLPIPLPLRPATTVRIENELISELAT